jgi:ribose transport system substrate-binding protein
MSKRPHVTRWIVLALCVTLALLVMTGIGYSARSFVFGVSLPSSDNPYWVAMRRGVERTAAAHGIKLRIAIANETVEKQVTDVEDMIQAGVDFLLVASVQRTGAVKPIEDAVKQGIPVIAIGRDCDSKAPVCWIGNNEAEVGRLAAEWLVEYFGPKGAKIVWLRGPAGAQSFADMEDGATKVFERNPQIEILTKLAGRDNRPTGMQLMEDALQAYPEIDAVFGGNDELALGALSAIEGANRKGIVVIGTNGSKDARDAVMASRLGMSVMKQPGLIGKLGVETAVAYLAGQRDIAAMTYAPVVLLTRDNISKVDLQYAP